MENELKKVTWDDDVQHYFTQLDIGCMMSYGVDLGNYDSVVKKADRIYARVQNGGMPKGGRPWLPTKVDAFLDWANAGAPKTQADNPPRRNPQIARIGTIV